MKVLVLAVIVGIGSTLFGEFTVGFGDTQPTIEDAMAIVLAALSLLGLGIFGQGIANGLISGGPPLGAGAAVGTGLAVGGAAMAGGAAMRMGASAVGATSRGSAFAVGGATGTWTGPVVESGAAGLVGGGVGVAKAGAAAATSPLRNAAGSLQRSFVAGGQAGSRACRRAARTPGPSQSSAAGPPDWARRMKRGQALSHGATAVRRAVRSGGRRGRGASISVSGKELKMFKRPSVRYGRTPNPKHPTSAPAKRGMSASARRGCRQKTGG